MKEPGQPCRKTMGVADGFVEKRALKCSVWWLPSVSVMLAV
jgi:hypothetical protein